MFSHRRSVFEKTRQLIFAAALIDALTFLAVGELLGLGLHKAGRSG